LQHDDQLARRVRRLEEGVHLHYLKHLAWLLVGGALGLGVLSGVGGNGAITMLAALVGAIVLFYREGGSASQFAVWMPAGTVLFVGSVFVLAALWPTCSSQSCAWVGPTGDPLPLLATSATAAIAAAGLLVAVERASTRRASVDRLGRSDGGKQRPA